MVQPLNKKKQIRRPALRPLTHAEAEVVRRAASALRTIGMHARWAHDRTVDGVVFEDHPERERVIRGLSALVRWFRRSDLARVDKKRAERLGLAIEYRPLLALLDAMARSLRRRRDQDPAALANELVEIVMAEFLLREDEDGWRLFEPTDGEVVPVIDPRRDAAREGGWHMLNTAEPGLRESIRTALLEIERVLYDSGCPEEMRRRWLGARNRLKLADAVRGIMARRLGSTRQAIRDRVAGR